MRSFEEVLAVEACLVDRPVLRRLRLPWLEFMLNPRMLRGSDFLMRWSQGEWSEKLVVEGLASTNRYFALPYGPSGVAPSDSVREFELYFERLEKAGLGKIKRPDLLVIRAADREAVSQVVESVGARWNCRSRRRTTPESSNFCLTPQWRWSARTVCGWAGRCLTSASR